MNRADPILMDVRTNHGIVEVHISRDAGHPWDGRPGFDVLEARSVHQKALDEFGSQAAQKLWHPWLIGLEIDRETGEPTEMLAGAWYKPSGAKSEWNDGPSNPHPGGST